MALDESSSATSPDADPDADRWGAVLARDPGAAGRFVYAVRTTGVYCRPGCPARRPNRANVRFFATPAGAEAAGFRACRRCRPGADAGGEPDARVVAACRRIERSRPAPTLAVLARAAGLGPSRFHELFRDHTGLTPRAYAAAVRAGRVREALAGRSTVTAAIAGAGYASSGRFYEEAPPVLGMSPATFRAGGDGVRIRHADGRCSLGAVLVAATDRGVCAILLGDDPDALRDDLRRRFPAAAIEPGDAAFAATVAAVVALVERPAIGLGLPLDIRGTAFQRRVWEALRAIPIGTTTSYAALAASLGRPSAVRAVAAACAANPLAVAVPCHRVVRSDGALAGYRWGLARKAALLQRERDGGPPGDDPPPA
jgi:AraC family transcriptional regulator of adaptative response/methylated-DNA-[protein]-cysteine methyltransferase